MFRLMERLCFQMSYMCSDDVSLRAFALEDMWRHLRVGGTTHQPLVIWKLGGAQRQIKSPIRF